MQKKYLAENGREMEMPGIDGELGESTGMVSVQINRDYKLFETI